MKVKKYEISPRLRALHALVPYVRVLVTYVPAGLTCPHALCTLVPYVPSCFTCPRALRTLVPYVLSCLTRFRALRALMPYVPLRLAYLTCLACPHVSRPLRALHALVSYVH